VTADALASPPALLRPWIAEAAPLPAAGAEIPLYPDAVKLGLEDTLLAAGVRILYASQPVGAVFEGDRIAGAVVGNKSGRQAILARGIVDATDWAIFARLAGAPFRQQTLPARVEVRRTLEFTGVGVPGPEPTPPTAQRLPARLGLVGNEVHLHRGYLGAAHALVECRFLLPLASADLPGRMALELEARGRTMDVAAHLVADHLAFAGAYLAQASWEVWLRSPWRLAADDDRAGDEWGVVPGAPNLFVVGTAAGGRWLGEADEPAHLLEPLAAARAGEALAPRVLAALETTPPPTAAHCIARCGAASPVPDASPAAAAVPASAAPHGAAGTDSRASIELREPFGAQRGRPYARVREPDSDVPVLAEVDVLVVGGGTSGATAAAVAAEQGARTAVLELNSGLGGTGTVGGVDSYWYGRRVGFTATVDRYYEDVAASLRQPSAAGRRETDREASRKWNIEAKMHGLLRWTLDAGAEPFFRTTIVGALVEPGRDGGRPSVRGVLAATPDGLRAILAKVTVDASGDADVAAFAGAETVYGSARDRLPLWYSLAQFVRPGVTRNNFTSSVDVSNVHDYTRAILAGRRRGECHDHGTYVAPRETRHIVGGVTLTLTDQLTFKRFPDTIAVCFSNSDIKGKSAAEWVLWGLLPPNVESEIPYRAVVPHDLDGVLVCGKAMSC
ncbi:MAG: FAD-dependent oxidoreductase, partial [Chloroflexota bacterium]|nr:FAD-dependent oxidoreductase [Chloroflexota bacterium]